MSDFNVENAKIQMRKGILEFCILGIIADGEVYASDILERLHAANLLVVEGTVYPLLTRLKNAGLVSYVWKESTEGPPRKYFMLTTQGEEALNELKVEWQTLEKSVATTVEHLLNK